MWYFVSAAALTADRLLKRRARANQLPAADGFIEFQHIENDGLAGSTLRSHPQLVKALPCAAFGINLPVLLHGFRKQNCPAKCGIALLLAGSGSNIYDRLKQGSVTDMLRFPKAPGRGKTLVFNVADFMIFLGALLTLLFHHPKSKR